MEPLFQKNTHLFKGATRDLWQQMYNFVCTRCFGWGIPCVMMVPMVDYLNHLPVDTSVSMFNLDHSKNRKTDYRMLFKQEFIESLDPEMEMKVKGQPVVAAVRREVEVRKIKDKFLKEMYDEGA